jgi:hypothetical protein
MHMQLPKILAKSLLLLGPNILEVLIPENHHPALSKQQRELVFLLITQLRELQAMDLCPDARRESRGRHARYL